MRLHDGENVHPVILGSEARLGQAKNDLEVFGPFLPFQLHSIRNGEERHGIRGKRGKCGLPQGRSAVLESGGGPNSATSSHRLIRKSKQTSDLS